MECKRCSDAEIRALESADREMYEAARKILECCFRSAEPIIKLDSLCATLRGAILARLRPTTESTVEVRTIVAPTPTHENWTEMKRAVVKQALLECGGNVRMVAQKLKISRYTVYRLRAVSNAHAPGAPRSLTGTVSSYDSFALEAVNPGANFPSCARDTSDN
jgi:regulatory Fis family protein